MKVSHPLTRKVKLKVVLKGVLKRYASCLSAIIIFFCGLQSSYAQITITTTPADISSAIAGQSYDAVINATAVSGNPVTLSVSPDIDAGSGLQFDATNPPAGSPLHLHGTTPVAGSWTFSVLATATAEAPLGQDFVINIRKPIDLMFVLDKSGSMSTLVTGGGQSRWSALNDGVNSFFSFYQSHLTTSGSATGDQMGIRMFSNSDAAPVNPPFNVNNFIPVTPTTNLATILNGDSPGGSTAMGAGLESAKTALFPGGVDNGHKKAILLFTDGEQNVPPPAGNVAASAGVNPSITGIDPDLTNGDKIQIHTIGLGVAGSSSQTLYHLAHESGVAPQIGISNIANELAATPPDLNLSTYLNSISNRLLLGSTPQYVDIRRNNFKMTGTFFGADETFTVSKNIDKIFISIMSQVKNESQARLGGIDKDGQPVGLNDTSYITSIGGNGWQTYILRVSGIKKKIPGFKSDGKWTIHAIYPSQTPSPYVISLTVDDHNSQMIGATTQTKELVVGDHLPLSIDLTKRGKPLTGATAIAVVTTSLEDLGDALARAKVDIKFSTDPDADNVGTQKLKELLKDSAFVKSMLDSNHVVNLTFDPAQKRYVGEFTHLDVSGVYQVAYLVSVNDSSLGEIKRYAEESIYIRFPEVDLNNSNVSLLAIPGTDSATLTFRPVAVNGKFIGPGWDKAIKLDGATTKIAGIVDNGDGSYSITIQGSLTDDVTLSIGGDKIYTGKLENIGKGGSGGTGGGILKQWWFWVALIVILIIIWLLASKKSNP